MKRKILFHISSLYGGGAERVMSYLINYFYKQNYNVVVVVCYEHDGEYEIDNNIRKIVIGESNILSQSKKLRKVINQENPDLCVSFMQGGNVRMVLANLFSKQKYVLSVRNDPYKEYTNSIFRWFAKHTFNKASGIVFQTEDAKLFFNKKIQNKSRIIYNPVNERFFIEHRKENTKDIVSLGRLTEQKNFELLIRSYNLIKDKIDDDLLIYGEGELKVNLENLISNLNLKDRVKLMGRTNDSKKVLENAKCFVMSSNFEGMPNALLEAVCTLTPSISTDCPCGGPKIILGNNTGILVPSNDEEILAEKMLELCKNDELRLQLSSNCSKKREEFKYSNIMNQWEEYFAKVMEKK